MVASASEQSRRLDAEVSDSLLVVVHDAEAVLLDEPLVLLLDFLHGEHNGKNEEHVARESGGSARAPVYLLLLFRHLLPSFRLGLEVLMHVAEVAPVQVGDLRLLLGRHFLKSERSRGTFGRFKSTVVNTQTRFLTFLQSLKKFFLKMSLVVYSWSNILEKNVATSSAEGLSFMGFPAKTVPSDFPSYTLDC